MRPPKPHELKKLPITKLDAVRRQLETTITLWFHDVDPVSVHTLVMAAHVIESMKEDETLEIFGCEKDGAK